MAPLLWKRKPARGAPPPTRTNRYSRRRINQFVVFVLSFGCAYQYLVYVHLVFSHDNSSTNQVPSNQEVQDPAMSYEQQFLKSTQPDPDQATIGYAALTFNSGFRNEALTFSAFVMQAYDRNFTQILLPTLKWKDLFGTEKRIPHEHLFDVVHWNSHFASSSSSLLTTTRPPLPRLVRHDPSMIQFDGEKIKWIGDFRNATKPYGHGYQAKLLNQYKQYTKRLYHQIELMQNHKVDSSSKDEAPQRHPSDVAILQGALQPHPDLISQLEEFKAHTLGGSPYLSLHARIEPDMLKHPVCKAKRVESLQKIMDQIYQTFPTPPPQIRTVLIAIHRHLLEQEAPNDPVTAQNLKTLNDLMANGMWNGAVAVKEAGRNALSPKSFFGQHAGISGAMTDYFLAVNAQIFVGTEISTFSTDIMASRYHSTSRTLNDNGKSNSPHSYMYTPGGMVPVGQTSEPPRFSC